MSKKKSKQEKCDDRCCPIHGNIGYRGRTFVGTVTDVKGYKSATVEWKRWHQVRKYERIESRKTKIRVHNSPCVNAKKGDKVELRETRPMSKTKTCVIVKVLGKDVGFMEKEEGIEESKVKKKPKEEEADKKEAEAKKNPKKSKSEDKEDLTKKERAE